MRILRGVGSRPLPCGCLAGVYETYDAEVVTILDAHAAWCSDPAHARGNRLADSIDSARSTPLHNPRSR